jgi:thiamine-phosphate pyrophosphorylase
VNDPVSSPALRLPRLNAILDDDVARRAGWTMGDLARACLAGGARFLQVRAKHLPSGLLLALCDEVVTLASPYDAMVIVNDRADLARLCGAAGVHVGQQDLHPVDVRITVGNSAIVGLSTHTIAQVRAARMPPIDYIAVGPVFGTGTKDTGYAAVGLDFVREAAALARGRAWGDAANRPVVAIGGITLDRARTVIDAGAASVAVISDLVATGDPESRVREYLRTLEQAADV